MQYISWYIVNFSCFKPAFTLNSPFSDHQARARLLVAFRFWANIFWGQINLSLPFASSSLRILNLVPQFMSCLLNLVPQFMSWLVNITPQFVNWLLDEDLEKWDEHWMPVSLRCRWNRKIMISMKIIRTTYLWFRQIKIKVPWAPFWNVLILVYGHCPNSFRPPPLLCQTMTFLLFNLLVTYKNIARIANAVQVTIWL